MTAASSWELDPGHEEFRASIRAFVDRHVRPVAEESEAVGRPPAALLKEMASAGLLGLSIPEDDGGTVRQEVNHGVTSQLGGYARLGAVYLTSALPNRGA